MWLRDAWYVAAWSEELGPDAILARMILNEPLVLYRKQGGGVVVLEDRCCHRLAPLSKGRLEGDDLRCMYHGLKFAPDGRCVEIPGQSLISKNAFVRHYPVAERGSWIWIWMGRPELADPALIPGSIAPDDTGWRLCRGSLDYQANYQLVNDNLLDLSHLSFVHANTLGRDSPQWAESRPKVIRLDRGLRFQRWLRGLRTIPHLTPGSASFDVWNAYDFLVPGIFIQRTYWYAEGTAARLGQRAPGEAEAALVVRADDQAVTPITERTSRYFYAAGARRTDVSDELAQKLFRFSERAFQEDRAIIEAQQQVIDGDSQRRMLPMSFDAGPTQFRQLINRMLRDETAGDRPKASGLPAEPAWHEIAQ